MNIRQENAVGTEMDDIPTLVEHGGKIVADKEMRHASAGSAIEGRGGRAGEERLVQHPVWSQIPVEIHARDGTPFQRELAVFEIRAGLLGLDDLFLKRRWQLRYLGSNGGNRKDHICRQQRGDNYSANLARGA